MARKTVEKASHAGFLCGVTCRATGKGAETRVRTARGLGKATEQNQEKDMPSPGFPLFNKIVQ